MSVEEETLSEENDARSCLGSVVCGVGSILTSPHFGLSDCSCTPRRRLTSRHWVGRLGEQSGVRAVQWGWLQGHSGSEAEKLI